MTDPDAQVLLTPLIRARSIPLKGNLLQHQRMCLGAYNLMCLTVTLQSEAQALWLSTCLMCPTP